MRVWPLLMILMAVSCLRVPVTFRREADVCVVPAGVYEPGTSFEGGMPFVSYTIDLRPGDPATAIVWFEGNIGGCTNASPGTCEGETLEGR